MGPGRGLACSKELRTLSSKQREAIVILCMHNQVPASCAIFGALVPSRLLYLYDLLHPAVQGMLPIQTHAASSCYHS